MVWKLADAKNKFSQVVDMALQEGPQKVTRRDEVVMVVSLKDYDRLSGKKKGFKEYLKAIPDLHHLNLARDRSQVREVRL